ncbi:lipopolysaccharide biosynthesis protein [Streptococcus equi subsp. zooepidemicus]|uniref:lipopolysaccharide biosynthesis protein n=1 Tax=Streptococcus equi TaxID=1336 RepID=UPI001E4DB2C0|nr:lipopolysaccharide biosynthesis protein [Streptococcus equi]MCD3370851.1 lipopolysaccharide biosynthesis protein [Streptococcus equi subsp. zooepidemicus]MCD3381252.1 lipopolysaccharide biosynthesis protein [Streptococcus equi subsp. zooepidemicus]HEL0563857.1 lipopolysaccharide biosynthesis protein [Streptococcus equi subsp. zooepidemicus]HEL1248440.1 lipopolysaccharide biosynthesis protein [Streptococcus equi subsp. zooepidemicus]HEL1282508.1 lipopolysaccharide biosynthesis protein [Strep
MKTSSRIQSDQSIFIWNVLGTSSTALISVILLMIVSRVLSKSASDTFSFAYAIGNQLITIGLFQVRNFQSTDILHKYHFKDYFYTRLVTCFLMIAISVLYIYWGHYSGFKGLVIWLICLYRCTDAISDVFQGMFQQRERLDIAGKSLFYRNMLVILGFTLCLVLTKQLVLSLIVICLISVACIVLFDITPSVSFTSLRRHIDGQSILGLLKESFPLFLNGFLLIYIYNQPKFVLEQLYSRQLIPAGVQTEFNILFMPIFMINLIFLFLRPMITQLAIYHSKEDKKSFVQLERRLSLVLLLASLAILVASYFVGLPVLSLVYGIDLRHYQLDFMLLIFGGIISTFATYIDNLITIIRKQRLLVIPYVVSFISSLAITGSLARSFGVIGVTYGFVISMLIWLLLSYGLYIMEKRK